ncbi:MAG TPA: TetR/AcrR family transcriptional regulator [Cyclobacteriaceae bacterium]|nr:TetR/AcrR family transcriptional regulator [Cyclobacteriaceae bacterium]
MHSNDNEKLLQIIESARKRFSHFGLAKTTMTEIASDIGVSKASLYYYFPDKEHLFAAVIEREMNDFIERMNVIVDGPGPNSEKLLHYVNERLASFKQLLNLGKFESANYDSLKPAFSTLWDDFQKRELRIVGNILEVGVSQGEFAIENIPLTSKVFVDLTKGLRMVIVKTRDTYILNEDDYSMLQLHQEHFVQLFLKAISRT